jgi:DNA replication protein DnaC
VAELITERIRRNASELRLHGIADDPDELIERAEREKLGYREFLDLVLESEAGVLEGRRYASRLKMAGLPHHKTLDEFDVSSPSSTPSAWPSCARCGSSSARSAA